MTPKEFVAKNGNKDFVLQSKKGVWYLVSDALEEYTIIAQLDVALLQLELAELKKDEVGVYKANKRIAELHKRVLLLNP